VVGNLRVVPPIPLVMAVGVVLPDGVVLPPENVGVLRPPRTPRTNLNNSYNSRTPNIQRSTTPQPIPTYTARARTPTPRTSSIEKSKSLKTGGH
jgi:hypothetical protein